MSFACKKCGYEREDDYKLCFCLQCGESDNANLEYKNQSTNDLFGKDILASVKKEDYDASADWSKWYDAAAGNSDGVQFLTELEKYTDSFLLALNLTDVKSEDRGNDNQQKYEQSTKDAQSEFEKASESVESEYNAYLEGIEKTKENAERIFEACKKYYCDIATLTKNPNPFADPKEESIFHTIRSNIKESIKKSLSANALKNIRKIKSVFMKIKNTLKKWRTPLFVSATSFYNDVTEKKKELDRTLDAKRRALEVYKKALELEAESNKNARCNTARSKQISRDLACENEHAEERNSTISQHQNGIKNGFTATDINSYVNNAEKDKIDVNNFKCPASLPDNVVLGDICLDIIGGNRNSNAVIESVEKQAQEFGTRTENGYTVRIPYCQSVKDGILLNVCYSSDDAIDAQSLLQQLLLKMFMSLPAGKLEVTMIDPTYSGKYFSDICNLSTSTETTHIIDTNVWTRENDIGTAISTLRQRLEETVQAYGDHKDIILEDEPVRMLAITDFPNGFDNTSLRDLNTILNAGAFAFIFGAKDKIQEFKEQNPSLASLADDILKQTVEVSLENGRLMFSSDPSNRLYLEPDLMEGLTGRTKDNILIQLGNAISKYTPPSVSFSELFDFDIYDSNNWRQGAIDEFCVPIGKKGRSVFNMVLGRSKGAVQHHALVSGTTGAGKSTFLHTLILSTMITYSPEDVQMYLIDFKEGDEFAIYAKYRLPSLRVVSLKSEREFGIMILRELYNEYYSRINKFKEVKSANIVDIDGYEQECENRPHMEKIPRLLVIFDEVEALFRGGGNSQEAILCINALSSQGRAAGIYLVLASQTFNGCDAIDFSQFSIRIAIKGTTESAAKVLNPDNRGIQSLQNRPIGTAIYNTQAGDSTGNNTIKVAIADDTEKHTSEKQRIVEKLHDFYTKDSTGRYSDMQTRVYLANAQDDVNHFINKMICNNGVKRSVRNPDEYKVMLGLDYLKIGPFSIEFGKQNNDNMLIVGADEKKAISIFEMTALSALYCGQRNARVFIIDFSNDTFLQYACKLSDLGVLFGDQISIAAGITKAQEMIDKIHSAMNRCEQQNKQCKQRIFFMFFGAQKQLVPNTIYGNPYTDKLKEIFSKGPQYGINSIVWGDSLLGSERLLGDNCEYMFSKRVAYGLNDNDMIRLVGENNSSQLGEHTAVYKDASTTNNTHFRPYDIPSKKLISDFSNAYNKFVN